VRDAESCPACGFLLRYEDLPDGGAVRYILVDLLRWAALVLFFAFLWAGAETRELYAALAFIAFAAWLALRPRQRAHAAALLERRRYHCAQCKRDFSAPDLKPPGA
jgi:hypothetical protein